jgi:hypothetical protein
MTTTTKTTTRTRTKKPATVEVVEKEVKLPPNPFMNEILDFVSEKETDEDKIKALKEYENDALKALFIWNFDSTVISVLPQGEVPFRPNENPLGTDHSSLRREFKHLYNFVKGGNDTLSTVRRETIFIQILESLHPNEAEVLCLVKDKDLTSKYDIPFELIEQAYPDIQWGGRS